MSALETILARMMSDAAFADGVFADAEKALTEYNLSAEDLAKFKGMSRARFEAMTAEDRKSFGILVDERHGGWDANHNEIILKVK